MKRFYPNLITLLLLLTANVAHAETYYVATTGNDANAGTQIAPFQSLQRGINAAADGDIVLVANGVYFGQNNDNLNFNYKGFTLKSQGGAANCVIDGDYRERLFYFSGGSTSQMVVDGFTVQNGFAGDISGGRGGAVYMEYADPKFRNCVFSNNAAIRLYYAYGGAIYALGSSPRFENCHFENNRVTAVREEGMGGAIYTERDVVDSLLTLHNCTFVNNHAAAETNARGGALSLWADHVILSDCSFDGNSATAGNYVSGGAIEIYCPQASLL